jgi:hypothetical protein
MLAIRQPSARTDEVRPAEGDVGHRPLERRARETRAAERTLSHACRPPEIGAVVMQEAEPETRRLDRLAEA